MKSGMLDSSGMKASVLGMMGLALCGALFVARAWADDAGPAARAAWMARCSFPRDNRCLPIPPWSIRRYLRARC